MVELAIILPIFLLLVFGVVQFGITYNNLITVTMKGNPSTVTLSYDQSKNHTETHPVTTTSCNGTPDNNGLSS